MNKKIERIICFFVFVFIFCCQSVQAVVSTHDAANTRVCFNRSNGSFVKSYSGATSSCGSGNGTDRIKLINGEYAYCLEWRIPAKTQNYLVDTSWNSSSGSSIFAGYIIDEVAARFPDGPTRYEMTAASLNTFSARYLGNGNSYNFYSSNSTIQSIYEAAYQKYSQVKLSSQLPGITITPASKVLKYTSNNTYLSDKISVSGLLSTYGGGSGSGVTYKIKVSASQGNIYICSKPNGAGCQSTNEVTLTSPSSGTYDFYIKADSGVKDVNTITVSVTGSNSSTYPSTIKYLNSNYPSSSQHLITRTSVAVSRSVSASYQLTVPDTINHRIIGYKIDATGSQLTGASLAIYKDDYTIESNLLSKNDGKSSIVNYISKEVATSDDDFFSHDYYLVERSAPDGYVLNSTSLKFYEKDSLSSSSGNSTICYYNGGSESSEGEVVSDTEHCNFDNYVYKCNPSDGSGLIDPNEEGTCTFDTTTPGEDIPPESSDGEDSGNTGEDGENVDSGDVEVPSEPVEPEVTYETVCYSKSSNQIADMTYCADKADYTKVEQSSGNLVVFQTNMKNILRISKKAATGNKEVSGASLKICTDSGYLSKGENCDPATTIDNVEMSWVSGAQAYEFSGVKKGNYYIIETVAPKGYIKAKTVTSFSMDETGTVRSGDTTISYSDFGSGSSLVINNQLNTITISKQDMATSKELPGATISICRTYVDENNEIQLLVDQYDNECISATLSDGSAATWVSTDQEKVISGLPAGTYYLVEKIAPTDYTTAESILFTLKEDGSLIDKDGNLLKDSKLIMQDKSIHDVKTGEFPTYVVGIILVVAVTLGIGSYAYLNSKSVQSIENSSHFRKIRRRRLHKK